LINREHRRSRKNVYELYLEYEKYEDVLIFDGSPEVVDVGADNIIHILLIA